MTTERSIIHAYRHMYKGLLQAVQYSSPARRIVRDQVRKAFRDEKGTLDQEALKRTLWFLDAATKERGLEHKILKNLVTTHFSRTYHLQSWKRAQHAVRKQEANDKPDGKTSSVIMLTSRRSKENAPAGKVTDLYQHYDMTLAMLNKSMGLCLR